MKKFFLVVIAVVMLVGHAVAEFDLSGMSKEELNELHRQVSVELFGRRLTEGARVYEGTYIVGEDIPTGRYMLKGIGVGEMFAFGYVEGYDADGKKVKSVLGRLENKTDVLLLDVTEECVTIKFGCSDNMEMYLYPRSFLWAD